MQKINPMVFEWSERGRELLAKILSWVSDCGGSEKLVAIIERENRTPYRVKRNTHYWSDSEELFLIKNHHKMYHEEIAGRLNRTDDSVKYKIKCLYRDGVLTHKMPLKSHRNRNDRPTQNHQPNNIR